MTDGLVFVVCGDKAQDSYRHAHDALEVSGNAFPVQVIGSDYGAVNKQASRHAKTTLYGQAQFDRYVYLDADTRARENLAPVFDILADGWDIVIVPSNSQGQDAFWHVTDQERRATFEQLGVYPLQLQCGVMAVAKNERTAKLYETWYAEWNRYRGEDQAAFIRALYACPVKVWLLGYPWNGGAAIGHNWGETR